MFNDIDKLMEEKRINENYLKNVIHEIINEIKNNK